MLAGFYCIYTVHVVCNDVSLVAQFCKNFQFNFKCRKCKNRRVSSTVFKTEIVFCRLEVSLLYVQECLHLRLPDNRHCQTGAHSKRAPLNPLKPPRQGGTNIAHCDKIYDRTIVKFHTAYPWSSQQSNCSNQLLSKCHTNGAKGYVMSVWKNTCYQ